MKKITLLLISSFLLSCSTSNNDLLIPLNVETSNIQSKNIDNDLIKDEFIVKFKTNSKNNISFLSTLGTYKQIQKTNMYLLKSTNKDNIHIIGILQKRDDIAFVEQNRKIKVKLIKEQPLSNIKKDDNLFPNDELFSKQYSHTLTKSQEAWKKSLGSENVTIAIVDSGVDRYHPDLKEKLVEPYNVLNPSYPNGALSDPLGHGTHCAGIAAAVTNNNVGVAGVAPKAKIQSVRVLDEEGGGTNAGVAEGIIWASSNGADIINLSLGSPKSSQAIKEAVISAIENNVLVIAAAGNDGDETQNYPAAYTGVLSVGSTNEKDAKSNFSQYGSWIKVTAPGSNIISTLPTYGSAMEGKNYGLASGTSMASPFVAGLAALIKGAYPHLGAPGLITAIQNGTDDLGETGFDNYFGYGRVNVEKALNVASKLK